MGSRKHNANRIGSEAKAAYYLLSWARGELSAPDALDRVREVGGHVTMTQYAMMRGHDATGTQPETVLPESSTVGSSWSRKRWAKWATA